MKGIVQEAQRIANRSEKQPVKRGQHRYTTPDGKTHTGSLRSILNTTGITLNVKTVERRLQLGWPLKRALETPARQRRSVA